MESNSTAIEGRHQPLVLRLQSAVAHMAPHQKERQNGRLLIECLDAINDMEIRHAATMMHTQTIVDEANELRRTNEGLQLTFELRWKADQRAIKRWQAAHPGNDLTWPDHADMVVWLMDKISSENARSMAPGSAVPDSESTNELGR